MIKAKRREVWREIYSAETKWINEMPSISSRGCIRTFVLHPVFRCYRSATACNTSARNARCPVSSQKIEIKNDLWRSRLARRMIRLGRENDRECSIMRKVKIRTHSWIRSVHLARFSLSIFPQFQVYRPLLIKQLHEKKHIYISLKKFEIRS